MKETHTPGLDTHGECEHAPKGDSMKHSTSLPVAKTATQSKATPGPWTTRGGLVLVGDESNSGNVIAIVNCGGKGGLSLEVKAIEANARLIASAPDLLSCLKAAEQEIRLTAAIYEQENKPETAKELRIHAAIYAKAIAKAEGTP